MESIIPNPPSGNASISESAAKYSGRRARRSSSRPTSSGSAARIARDEHVVRRDRCADRAGRSAGRRLRERPGACEPSRQQRDRPPLGHAHLEPVGKALGKRQALDPGKRGEALGDRGEVECEQVLRSVGSERCQNFFGALPLVARNLEALEPEERAGRDARREGDGESEQRRRRDRPNDRHGPAAPRRDAPAPKEAGLSHGTLAASSPRPGARRPRRPGSGGGRRARGDPSEIIDNLCLFSNIDARTDGPPSSGRRRRRAPRHPGDRASRARGRRR